jgi:hypothetical protein
MTLHELSATAEQSGALACRSAVSILRAPQQPASADKELMRHLDGLLSALSLELQANCESVPKSVRCAAVQLASHIIHRSAIPVPRQRQSTSPNRPIERPGHRPQYGSGIPFTRSIRLGRMG